MSDDLYKRGPVIFVDWRDEPPGKPAANIRVLINLCAALVVGYVAEQLGAEYGIGADGIHTSLDDIMEAFADQPEVFKDGVTSLRCRLLMELTGMEIQFISSTKTVTTVLVAARPQLLKQVLWLHFAKFAKAPVPSEPQASAIMTVLNQSVCTINFTLPG